MGERLGCGDLSLLSEAWWARQDGMDSAAVTNTPFPPALCGSKPPRLSSHSHHMFSAGGLGAPFFQ